MNIKVIKVLGFFILICLIAIFIPPKVIAKGITERIGGDDRFEVSVNISKKHWGEGSRTVYLSNYVAFADALSAAPLAFKDNSPILLTYDDRLPNVTKQELQRLKASRVVLIGGKGSISEKVQNEIQSMRISVERISGADRFEVSANIASKIGNYEKAVVTNGLTFADALAIAPYASRNETPILLTKKEEIPKVIQSKLNRVNETLIVGGIGSVSKSIETDLPNSTRIGGQDRFEVAANIIEKLELHTDRVYMATGLTFADALTGSVAAAMENSPILLTRPTALPTTTSSIIKNRKMNNFLILGGTGSVSSNINNNLLKTEGLKTPVVYFVPHADDEVLTYGVDIRNMIASGRKVYLVLLSKGEDSGARDIQNGVYDVESKTPKLAGKPIFCWWHGVYHNPIEEKYLHGHISQAEFAQARVEDFFRASLALGVPKSSIIDESFYLMDYNSVTAKKVMEKYISLYPNADFRTMSEYDQHDQHAFLGKVLEQLEAENKVAKYQTKYFVSIYTGRFSGVSLNEKKYAVTLTKASDSSFVKNAIESYKYFYPEQGIYANGYHSVAIQFNSLEEDMRSVFHY
ncbi:cell wall-binding repeat-containing protein [Fictibacillus halophilus]|uniref:cell wall-binding repeat-containing protein n=1 Tax=Fictibacillus halophilus TaxID=1610490 RepID=UPI001CFAC1FE|nr:cell wall-binding repeat-containing protein [Fictibacillus halophilus]